MNINITQKDDVTVVNVAGNIDALTAEELTSAMLQQVKIGHSQLVADLGGVEFMSSAGLRALLATLKDARGHGGDLRLCGAQPNIEKVLKMSGFTNILKTFKTADEAANSFRAMH